MSQYEYRVIGFGGMVGKPIEKTYEFNISDGEEVMEPKFKIGQEVTTGRDVFTILQMKLEKGVYFYRERDSHLWKSEELLSLHENPKKKKLYAYKDNSNGCFVRFAEINWFNSTDRLPEYDIEYPQEIIHD